jgi:hypothetical protein
MWDNGSRVVPIAIIACYGFSHYAMVRCGPFVALLVWVQSVASLWQNAARRLMSARTRLK